MSSYENEKEQKASDKCWAQRLRRSALKRLKTQTTQYKDGHVEEWDEES